MVPHTPLRYPGGKRRLNEVVKRLLDLNGLHDVHYVEPFAGGAAIAIGLLFEEYASYIHLNDLSRPVFAFWKTALEQSDWLCGRIENVRVSMAEWRRQRAIFDDADQAAERDLGFAALFLNRTNRSGILAGGVIGGKRQTGKWSLDARFGKPELIRRIQKLGRYQSRIKLYNRDGLEFTQNVAANLKGPTFIFFDPPYIERAGRLYLNQCTLADHQALARCIGELAKPWIVTYDPAALEHHLFPKLRRIVYDIHYTVNRRYRGQEVMYFADSLRVPKAADLLGSRMRAVSDLSRVPLRRKKIPPRA